MKSGDKVECSARQSGGAEVGVEVMKRNKMKYLLCNVLERKSYLSLRRM